MSGTILRRRDRTARPPRVEHYSSAVNTRTPIDSLGHRGHEPGIRKQCADTRRSIGTIEFADSRP